MALLGVLASPFDIDEYTAETSFQPDLCMIFEHWDQQRDLNATFAKAKALGYKEIFLTWEPWTPTAHGIGNMAQGALQPLWSNESVAAGAHDTYIRAMSKSVRESGLTVYVRWGHEMNGDWHPWKTTPESYVAAWKRIVNTFRGGGTSNVRWVWSPNSNLFQDNINYLRGLLPYWPGKSYVDYVGTTMINFAGENTYHMDDFNNRIKLLRQVFGKTMIASELNCAFEIRKQFFDQLHGWVSENNPFAILNLSQPPISRGKENNITQGNMAWNAASDEVTAERLRQIKKALNESPVT